MRKPQKKVSSFYSVSHPGGGIVSDLSPEDKKEAILILARFKNKKIRYFL